MFPCRGQCDDICDIMQSVSAPSDAQLLFVTIQSSASERALRSLCAKRNRPRRSAPGDTAITEPSSTMIRMQGGEGEIALSVSRPIAPDLSTTRRRVAKQPDSGGSPRGRPEPCMHCGLYPHVPTACRRRRLHSRVPAPHERQRRECGKILVDFDFFFQSGFFCTSWQYIVLRSLEITKARMV